MYPGTDVENFVSGKTYDQVFEANYTVDMVEPHLKFLRDQESKAAKLHAAGHADNATSEAKEALFGSIYENYTAGMFWSQQNEDDFNEVPGTWTHAAATAAAAAAAAAAPAQERETESEMMTDGPSGDLKQPARWGLDVKVEGISNVTGLGDVMAIDQDSTPQGELGSPGIGGGSNSDLAQDWLPPVRLGQEDRVGLGDVPPLRHVWNMVSALFLNFFFVWGWGMCPTSKNARRSANAKW